MTTKQQIEQWLVRYKIRNYTISDSLCIDVKGGVDLNGKNLTHLPFKFRHVEGNFFCNDNCLTTLHNMPDLVGGNFYCYNNALTSLDHAPKFVGRDFNCGRNMLETLRGAPTEILGSLYAVDNQLKSLEGLPAVKSFDVSRNEQLEELQNAKNFEELKILLEKQKLIENINCAVGTSIARKI